MKFKQIDQSTQKTFALIFEPGDEVIETLTDFSKAHKLSAGQFTAIGAFSHATLGYFDLTKKDYKKIPVNDQVEVLILSGDVTLHNNLPKIHAHVVLGKADGSTVGGHLLNALVQPTLEVILTESPKALHRKIDEATGLPLISI